MNHKRAIIWAALASLALLLPPAAVFARQMLQMTTAPDQQAAKAIAASELRSTLDARRGFARSPNTISHPFEYPYLDCEDEEGGNVAPEINRTLITVFIVDAQRRDHLAELAALSEHFSRVQLALLTACIEASLFATRCQAIADDATKTAHSSEDPHLSDQNRAAAYCAAMTALGRTESAK